MLRKSVEEAPFNEKGFSLHHLFRDENERVFVISFKPNQVMPAHKHPGYHLYLLGYEGEGTFIINGVTHVCQKGDVFKLEPEDEIGIENDRDREFRVYCVMNKISEK